MQSPDTAPTRRCVGCGNALHEQAAVCPFCGHDYRATLSAHRSRTRFPEIGGAVTVASGASQVILGLVMLANPELLGDLESAVVIWVAAAFGMLIVGPLAMIGGVLAMHRRNLSLAVIAALLTVSMAGVTGIYGIAVYGLGLGLAGLILIVASRDEFSS